MDLKTLRFLGYTIGSVVAMKKYPPVEMFNYWHWGWNKNGKVEYSHIKTFSNFLFRAKKQYETVN
jgi:hypothetical protein